MFIIYHKIEYDGGLVYYPLDYIRISSCCFLSLSPDVLLLHLTLLLGLRAYCLVVSSAGSLLATALPLPLPPPPVNPLWITLQRLVGSKDCVWFQFRVWSCVSATLLSPPTSPIFSALSPLAPSPAPPRSLGNYRRNTLRLQFYTHFLCALVYYAGDAVPPSASSLQPSDSFLPSYLIFFFCRSS